MSQQFFGIVPRICEERVSYRGFGKRGKESENTEVDITDTKRARNKQKAQ